MIIITTVLTCTPAMPEKQVLFLVVLVCVCLCRSWKAIDQNWCSLVGIYV